jgi:hypothetical protein
MRAAAWRPDEGIRSPAPSLSLPILSSSSLWLSLPRVHQNPSSGRRFPSLFCTTPASVGVPYRSTSSPSSSPSKQSSRGAREHRRRPLLPHRCWARRRRLRCRPTPSGQAALTGVP